MTALKKWFKKTKETAGGNGLYASLEELIAMRRYVPYLRGVNQLKTFSKQAGDIKSAFKGRGMELEEIRSYTFGDDVRDIDWRVTARKDMPYTKLYAEEKDREIYVWLDLSAPMRFGTRRELKSVAAAKLAALLGWMALENKDRFGCVIFDGAESLVFKPNNSRAQLMAVLKKIAESSKAVLEDKNNLQPHYVRSFQQLERTVKNQATVFILSDFNGFDDAWQRQLASLAKKTRLYLFDIFDVLEEVAPRAGEYLAQYGGKRLVFDSGAKIYRQDYQNYFAEKRQKLKNFCRRFGCQLSEIRTDTEFAKKIKI